LNNGDSIYISPTETNINNNELITILNGKTIVGLPDIVILNYDILKKHIESLFLEGMSWENWGEWQIDHIKPISSFDKTTDTKIVNNLNNLQPLWASDNIRKGNKF
jgi:hypothetical protein